MPASLREFNWLTRVCFNFSVGTPRNCPLTACIQAARNSRLGYLSVWNCAATVRDANRAHTHKRLFSFILLLIGLKVYSIHQLSCNKTDTHSNQSIRLKPPPRCPRKGTARQSGRKRRESAMQAVLWKWQDNYFRHVGLKRMSHETVLSVSRDEIIYLVR